MRTGFGWILALATLLFIAPVAGETTITYTRDDAGRLVKADYGGGRTITYTYDSRGNMLSRTVAAGPSLPGDCDGDGAVSIGEVQKAINMFLGSIPPDCGVDANGDGSVSIGEVQKVINAFLGVAGVR